MRYRFFERSDMCYRFLYDIFHDISCSSKQNIYRSFHIWIDNTRLFYQPPTTTQMTSNVVVNQLVLFTMLQPFLEIHEE